MPHDERAAILTELDPPFTVRWPEEHVAPFVFCSPHSGRVYPSSLLARTRLDPLSLRKSEDCFVDELFADAASMAAPLIAARFPRAYLDVNREPYELDPHLFEERPPPYANTQSLRVAGGLGTIARVVSESEEIYAERLPLAVAYERIERLYKPFHRALADLVTSTRRRFGVAVLIDCHSMPSTSAAQPAGSRPDVVIGDRFGASCSSRLTRIVRDALGAEGYQVQLNRPYAGGYITEHYGRPAQDIHALQIEVNRALYLDEATLQPTDGFARLSAALASAARRVFAEFPQAGQQRAAAE